MHQNIISPWLQSTSCAQCCPMLQACHPKSSGKPSWSPPHSCPPWWSWKKNNPRKSWLSGNPPALPPCLVAMGLVMECFYSVLLLIWPKLKLIMSLALILASPKTPPPQHHKYHKVSRSRRNSTTTTTIHNPGFQGPWTQPPLVPMVHVVAVAVGPICASPSLRGQAGAAGPSSYNGEWSKAVLPWIPLLEPFQ